MTPLLSFLPHLKHSAKRDEAFNSTNAHTNMHKRDNKCGRMAKGAIRRLRSAKIGKPRGNCCVCVCACVCVCVCVCEGNYTVQNRRDYMENLRKEDIKNSYQQACLLIDHIISLADYRIRCSAIL